jgi:hypothetical protein
MDACGQLHLCEDQHKPKIFVNGPLRSTIKYSNDVARHLLLVGRSFGVLESMWPEADNTILESATERYTRPPQCRGDDITARVSRLSRNVPLYEPPEQQTKRLLGNARLRSAMCLGSSKVNSALAAHRSPPRILAFDTDCIFLMYMLADM